MVWLEVHEGCRVVSEGVHPDTPFCRAYAQGVWRTCYRDARQAMLRSLLLLENDCALARATAALFVSC